MEMRSDPYSPTALPSGTHWIIGSMGRREPVWMLCQKRNPIPADNWSPVTRKQTLY
jgi:hypothetical protein